jgi:hypothetical protein
MVPDMLDQIRARRGVGNSPKNRGKVDKTGSKRSGRVAVGIPGLVSVGSSRGGLKHPAAKPGGWPGRRTGQFPGRRGGIGQRLSQHPRVVATSCGCGCLAWHWPDRDDWPGTLDVQSPQTEGDRNDQESDHGSRRGQGEAQAQTPSPGLERSTRDEPRSRRFRRGRGENAIDQFRGWRRRETRRRAPRVEGPAQGLVPQMHRPASGAACRVFANLPFLFGRGSRLGVRPGLGWTLGRSLEVQKLVPGLFEVVAVHGSIDLRCLPVTPGAILA